MFTQITQIGYNNLQNIVSGNKLVFTRYEVGLLPNPSSFDLTDVAYTTSSIIASNTLLSKFNAQYNSVNVSAMTHTNIDDTQTIFKMVVPQDYIYFKVNAIVIYGKVGNGYEFPFLISYSLDINPKFSTETNKYGTRYFYMLQLNLTDRDNRFDFSAIALETPDFPVVNSHYDLQPPYLNTWQQAIVNKHINIKEEQRLLIINSEEQFFGILMSPYVLFNTTQLTLGSDPLTLEDDPLTLGTQQSPDIILT